MEKAGTAKPDPSGLDADEGGHGSGAVDTPFPGASGATGHRTGARSLVSRQQPFARSTGVPLTITDLLSDSLGHTAYRRVKRGECLFRCGDEFRYLYPVRSGFFKTIFADGDGREQVTGFIMSEEHLGMDGIDTGRYQNTAVALEDSEVLAIPYALIKETGRATPSILARIDHLLSEKIARNHRVLMMLGSMAATERLATFLLDLSARLQQRGFSASELMLRMTREEIGSYLGLKLETVSRLLSKLREAGLIKVDQRHITITDAPGLKAVLHRLD